MIYGYGRENFWEWTRDIGSAFPLGLVKPRSLSFPQLSICLVFLGLKAQNLAFIDIFRFKFNVWLSIPSAEIRKEIIVDYNGALFVPRPFLYSVDRENISSALYIEFRLLPLSEITSRNSSKLRLTRPHIIDFLLESLILGRSAKGDGWKPRGVALPRLE